MKKEIFCSNCGKKFAPTGREHICPACKAEAAANAKKAAVERAKMRSYTGEACPVRISGRASTVIRLYGTANNLPFTAALDALLKGSEFFKSTGKAWEDVTPYKSHRRDKHATENEQEVTKAPQEAPQATSKQASKPQEVTKVAKKAVKATSKTASKASKATASKASTSKAGR